VTPTEILGLARAKGVYLWAHGAKLRWRCRGYLPDDLRLLFAANKQELLESLRVGGSCRKCGRERDEKGRCWTCFDRPCVGCGRSTGSAFIATCFPCGNGPDAPAAVTHDADPS
jgi:hypothetical protein